MDTRSTAELVHRWRVFETAIALEIVGVESALREWCDELTADEAGRLLLGLQQGQVDRLEEAHAPA